jgi:hypothetical protein
MLFLNAGTVMWWTRRRHELWEGKDITHESLHLSASQEIPIRTLLKENVRRWEESEWHLPWNTIVGESKQSICYSSEKQENTHKIRLVKATAWVIPLSLIKNMLTSLKRDKLISHPIFNNIYPKRNQFVLGLCPLLYYYVWYLSDKHTRKQTHIHTIPCTI